MGIATVVHAVGTLVGVVCALTSAFLMLNLRTDEKRLSRGRIVRRIMPVTWLAFIALVVSGIVLAVNAGSLNTYMLAAKHVLVVVLLVDATLIHFRFFPRYFKSIGTPEFDRTYSVMRKVGALSVSCWIIILVLSVLLYQF